MKYPKHMGPESQAAELAWLYYSLGAAWSLVAQYQALEAGVERERLRESLQDLKFKAKPYRESPRADDDEVHPDEGPATEGGRTC